MPPVCPSDTARRVALLSAHVLPARFARVRATLRSRIADTVLVLENSVDPIHVGAGIRTAEAFGIAHVHVIERTQGASAALIGSALGDKGSARWVRVHRHRNAVSAVAALRDARFSLAAACLGDDTLSLSDAVSASLRYRPDARGAEGAREAELGAATLSPFREDAATASDAAPLRPRVAVIMGSESRGVSSLLASLADTRFSIPQIGFVQSLSLSAATAIALHAFVHRTPDYAMRGGHARGSVSAESAVAAAGGGGVAHPVCEGLSEEEVDETMERWLLSQVRAAEHILTRAGLRPRDF